VPTTQAEGLRERGKRRRVERILDAASELLRERPDEALTVDRIAERAEVAPATVFNLVGPREQIWAALADRVFGDLDAQPVPADDPQGRARAVVDGVMRRITADPAVVRALLAGWSQSGRVLHRDPTDIVLECLEAAERDGTVEPGTDLRRLAQLVGAGLNGAVHQWAAGVISDRQLRARGVDLVDLAFVAARGPNVPSRWRLSKETNAG